MLPNPFGENDGVACLVCGSADRPEPVATLATLEGDSWEIMASEFNCCNECMLWAYRILRNNQRFGWSWVSRSLC